MKVRSSVWLTAAALTLLLLGILLPDIVSAAQSRSVTAGQQQYEVETIQLQTLEASAGLYDVLRLVSGEYRTMSLTGGNVLTEDEAYLKAIQTLEFISGYKLNIHLQDYTVHKETPVLVYTEDGETAAVLWQCELLDYTNDISIYMLIDDESGKMVSFQYLAAEGDYQSSEYSVDAEDDFRAMLWAEMCVVYYEFENCDVKTDTGDGNTRQNELIFTASGGEVITLIYYAEYLSKSTTDAGQGMTDAVRSYISFN